MISISNVSDDYHNGMVCLKMNIALMIWEKTNSKLSKTLRVVCVQNRAVLRA